MGHDFPHFSARWAVVVSALEVEYSAAEEAFFEMLVVRAAFTKRLFKEDYKPIVPPLLKSMAVAPKDGTPIGVFWLYDNGDPRSLDEMDIIRFGGKGKMRGWYTENMEVMICGNGEANRTFIGWIKLSSEARTLFDASS